MHTRAVQPVATSPIAISPTTYCHYDIILTVTSFDTELATPTATDVRMYVRTDTLYLTAFNI